MENVLLMYLNNKRNCMNFEIDKIYHVYNRGNNRQTIFFMEENYLFFLRKIRKLLLPNCELLAYCLMPNHFHLLIYATEKTISFDNQNKNNFSEAMRKLLSQYSKAINKQENRTSSLFQQNTKAKVLRDFSNSTCLGITKRDSSCHENRGMRSLESALTCFVYIHNNPLKITNNILSKWKYSSYLDYAGIRNGNLCNKELAQKLIGFKDDEFLFLFEKIQIK